MLDYLSHRASEYVGKVYSGKLCFLIHFFIIGIIIKASMSSLRRLSQSLNESNTCTGAAGTHHTMEAEVCILLDIARWNFTANEQS